MVTLEELKREIEPFKNTLVIDPLDSVVRLVDVSFEEDDYYWIFDSKNGLYYSSCLVDWIPLKGYIPIEKYDRLVRIWNLNNEVKAI